MNKIKLKIYNFKKNRKYKLNKTVKIISLILAPIMIASTVTGCKKIGKQKYDINNYDDYNTSVYNYDKESYNSTEEIINSVVEEIRQDSIEKKVDLNVNNEYSKYYNMKVNLSSSDFIKFNKIIDEMQVEYPFSELFYIDDAYALYKKADTYKSDSTNIFVNRKITPEKLFSIVKKNNDGANKNAYINDNDLTYVCKVMCNLINDFVADNKNIDLNNLSQKLISLKIRNFDEFSNGYYDYETTTLGLAFNKLKSDDDLFRKTIEHECFHFLCFSSEDEIKKANYSSKSGISYKFPNLLVNSLSWEWFNEASAEYLTNNYNNTHESKVYGSLIKSLDTIKVATLLGKNRTTTSFENLAYADNLDDLFKYFNAKTENQKIEIIKMMYAYNIIFDVNYTSSSKDFYRVYKNKYGTNMSNQEGKNFVISLKGSIATTLSKYFYKDLCDLIVDKNISIKEIFSLISIYENEISRETWYHTYISDMPDFSKKYNEIQTNFFRILANKLGVTTEEIQVFYNDFNDKEKIDIFEVNFLNKNKLEYLDYILETRKNDKMESINCSSKNNLYNGKSR